MVETKIRLVSPGFFLKLCCEFGAGERCLVSSFRHVGLLSTYQLQHEQCSLEAGRLWLSYLKKLYHFMCSGIWHTLGVLNMLHCYASLQSIKQF